MVKFLIAAYIVWAMALAIGNVWRDDKLQPWEITIWPILLISAWLLEAKKWLE